MNEVVIKYLHDGGPSEATLITQDCGYIDGKYKIVVLLSDPSDHIRMLNLLHFTFKKNEVRE